MKTDAEVQMYLRERRKGKTQEQAAARAKMSPTTARKYERAAKLPSHLKEPRTYRTRPDPFADDWPWVQSLLERDPALQAETLFRELCARRPGVYQSGQVRTFHRRVATWRALHGPEREVMFPQVHLPARMAQSDFTHMDDLQVTIAGQPFPHLLYHLVLTYSNWEAIHLCFTENFESLAEGIEVCLWQLGGVPKEHRTDNLSAAVRQLDAEGRKDFTTRYSALMAHYGMTPSTNNAGLAHENGDVEQAHHRFKQAVDQALRLRGSRDFSDRATYVRFLQDLVRNRNLTRQTRIAEERAVLRPLPSTPLQPCRELEVRVSPFSTIQVLRNTYSVPSRLIGHLLVVRVRADSIDVYHGATRALTLPRLNGRHQHHIDYHHIIWSLVRKPRAFANYRFREALFPRLSFRKAYDVLLEARPARADQEYLRVLHLAASTSENDVEAALNLLLERGQLPCFDAVRELVRPPQPLAVPEVTTPTFDLSCYDALLATRCQHG